MYEYTKDQIPYSLLETGRIEAFLTDKAKKDFVLKEAARFYPSGKFGERLYENYRYSVAMYGRRVTKEEAETERFKQFCSKWEENGWEYVCPYQTLVVFSSHAEERPPEPEEKNSWWRDETVIDAACREENFSILVCLAGQLPLSLLYTFIFVNPWMNREGVPGPLLSLLIWSILFFLWITAPLERKLRQRKARRFLREQHRVPEFEIFGNEGRLMALGAIIAGSLAVMLGIWELSARTVWMAAGAVLFSALLIPVSLWPHWRKKGTAVILKVLGLLPVLVAVLSIVALTNVRNYRFMRSGAEFYSYDDKEGDKLIELGISPEEIGFGDEWISSCVSQPNLACDSEKVIYREEKGNVDYGKPDYGKELRYVGTVRAELKKPEYLDAYLKQKKVTLEKNTRLALDGRREYYLTGSGKEIVGVDGSDVVIYFLNLYDERSFQANDPKLLAAVERLD